MRTEPLAKLWLALLLLVCSLASAPLGSMEQAGAALVGGAAHLHSVPVARGNGEALASVLALDAAAAGNDRAPSSSVGIAPASPASISRTTLPHLASRDTGNHVPDLLARLPYHATAPPSPAPPTRFQPGTRRAEPRG
jgi:hypothetical protein